MNTEQLNLRKNIFSTSGTRKLIFRCPQSSYSIGYSVWMIIIEFRRKTIFSTTELENIGGYPPEPGGHVKTKKRGFCL